MQESKLRNSLESKAVNNPVYSKHSPNLLPSAEMIIWIISPVALDAVMDTWRSQ
ncbi:hypothetical protein K443DRAFT_328622 [Laccaria amethystina LaAM-08-1]|uniref:Uncharacterized protein n=1 Tax=Laccaria amethystina LaAM-08-1 TaxID=1095629 RepID=A0A0C9XH51_9AGAR|nr:hypothetical protein K443DRAFT_328622 [Laccaria amethystina LaAM-08-1]